MRHARKYVPLFFSAKSFFCSFFSLSTISESMMMDGAPRNYAPLSLFQATQFDVELLVAPLSLVPRIT